MLAIGIWVEADGCFERSADVSDLYPDFDQIVDALLVHSWPDKRRPTKVLIVGVVNAQPTVVDTFSP